jgi:Domain of unknown function (DUF222)
MFDGVGFDIAALTDEELVAEVRDLTARRRELDAREARLLAELDERGTCDRDVGLSTSQWLAREAALPATVARSRANVAKKLRRSLHATADALDRGEISWEQARVMADAANPRIEADLATIENDLLDAAHGVGVDRWRQEVQGLATLLDQDGGHDPADDIESNRLHLGHSPDGLNVSGSLVGEQALISETAIEGVADELFRHYTHDHNLDPAITVPSRPTLRALALAELCRRGSARNIESSKPPQTEAVIVLHPDDPLDQARDLDGVRLADSSTRTLRCAAGLVAMLVDSLGVPLAMGRTIRTANRAQRRALALRDGGCVFPGCGAPMRWCDAHHFVEWDDGGHTDVPNMALLCRRHHGVIHRTRDGTLTRSGQRHGRTRDGTLTRSG